MKTVFNTSRLALRRANNLTPKAQVRKLNVHEYVSMEIMREFDIPVPKGDMAETKEDAVKKYKDIIGMYKDTLPPFFLHSVFQLLGRDTKMKTA